MAKRKELPQHKKHNTLPQQETKCLGMIATTVLVVTSHIKRKENLIVLTPENREVGVQNMTSPNF